MILNFRILMEYLRKNCLYELLKVKEKKLKLVRTKKIICVYSIEKRN